MDDEISEIKASVYLNKENISFNESKVNSSVVNIDDLQKVMN
jgi:hypothetical protein